jgi:hypothetical protein
LRHGNPVILRVGEFWDLAAATEDLEQHHLSEARATGSSPLIHATEARRRVFDSMEQSTPAFGTRTAPAGCVGAPGRRLIERARAEASLRSIEEKYRGSQEGRTLSKGPSLVNPTFD